MTVITYQQAAISGTKLIMVGQSSIASKMERISHSDTLGSTSRNIKVFVSSSDMDDDDDDAMLWSVVVVWVLISFSFTTTPQSFG